MWRFSECAASIISPSIYMIRSCRSTLWLNTVSLPPPPPLRLSPIFCPSDFRRPSSFCAGISTHTGVEVNHSPLSTFFWSPQNSARAPNSTYSMVVVLQDCKNIWTRLWIQSIKSSPKRVYLAKALSYCWSKRSMWPGPGPNQQTDWALLS